MSTLHKQLMKSNNIQIYCVGGCVRDIMLGSIPKDIDYVVVGATPTNMIKLGFKQVGADFPVFLHPETGEEYSLARIERKVGVGYNGFECNTENVPLIDDLSRRDLTINSMSVLVEDWEQFVLTRDTKLVFDPFSGKDDLKWHVLRHTTKAFSEDPVRVLRTARFAARYNFNITDSTKQLMADVVHELNHVSTERIWAEFEKGLMEPYSHRMFEVLIEIGAFNVEVMKPWGYTPFRPAQKTRSELLEMATTLVQLPTRFALIGTGFTPETFESHHIPNDCAELSQAVNTFEKDLLLFECAPSSFRLNIIMNLRALLRPQFVHQIFDVLDILFEPGNIKGSRDQFDADVLAIKTIDAATLAAECKSGAEIKEKLYNARLEAMS